jgi:phosphoglycerate dehydrogenase-like enzyme
VNGHTRSRKSKVVIAEPLLVEIGPIARSFRIVEVTPGDAGRAELLSSMNDAVAVVVRNRVRVDQELLDHAPYLRIVGRLGAGLENVDLAALGRRGITVLHGSGLNATAVAEYTLCSAVLLARKLLLSDLRVRRGEWTRERGMELGGRTFGVVGLGRVGAATAQLARAYGMRIVGFDPFLPDLPKHVEREDLHGLLRRADVVSLHVPLTSSTANMIGPRELALMPDHAILVNVSRGGVVDEAALYDALAAGRLGGAALDVREVEAASPEDKFVDLPNVLLTPHVAGLTDVSQNAIVDSIFTDIRRIVSGAEPRGPAILPPAP